MGVLTVTWTASCLLESVSQDISVSKHLCGKAPYGNIHPVISGEYWRLIIWMNTAWSFIVKMKDCKRYWVERNMVESLDGIYPICHNIYGLKKAIGLISVWGELQMSEGTIGMPGSLRKMKLNLVGLIPWDWKVKNLVVLLLLLLRPSDLSLIHFLHIEASM